MVVEEIKIKTAEMDNRPVVVYFNPWNYSDRTQLISQFFKTISSEIKLYNSNEKLKTVGSALQRYSDVIDYTTYIPVVGKYLEPLKMLASSVGQKMTEVAENNESLINQKDAVIKALQEQQQKIIVIIDDIDRLNNDQIRLIFQLVNSLAGFPNMIYLLSFDKSVVVRALEEEQRCNGEEYLEKIIQVPFDVPNAKTTSVHNVLFEMLNIIIFKEIPCDGFDKDYWNSVFSNCISPFINTIRDVNRVINVFRFKYGLMHNEVNCIDLLALTTLQVCAIDIYNWINDNIDQLTGSLYGMGMTGINQQKNEEKYIKEFSDVYCTSPKLMLQVIQTLFPKFSWHTGGYTHHSEDNDELRRQQNVACADRAPFYFQLSLEDVLIPKMQILSTIKEFDAISLDEYFDLLIKADKISEYLKELIAYTNDIPEIRLQLFLSKLMGLQTRDMLNKSKGIFEVNPSYMCMQCCWRILKRIEKEQAQKGIELLIESADMNLFSVIVEYIVCIQRSYGRIGTSTDYDYRIIEENQLSTIEKSALIKISELAKTENILEACSFINIYIFWKNADEGSMNEYIERMLQDPKNVPKYLSICATYWTGGRSRGWTFKEDSFSEHISADKAYGKILCLKNTSDFSSLKLEIKEIAVAYHLWYSSDKKDNQISKEVIDALIPDWEIK